MPVPFSLNPVPIPLVDDWKFRGKMFHFTYKDFIPPDELHRLTKSATSTPVRGYTIVHERTETTEVTQFGSVTTEYEHTHYGVIFQSLINLTGSRKFDAHVGAEQYHPNIQNKVTMVAMEQIFLHYHRGRKYSIEVGKMLYTKPVFLEQKLPTEFEWTEEILKDIISAPTLVAALVAGQVRPRSVNDVKTVRDDAAGDRKRFQHLFPANSFHLKPPPAPHALWVHGGTGLGKTKAACSWFSNPCLIKPFDTIGCLEAVMRKFDPTVHDGLILDEADLRFLTRQQVIALLDSDEDCEMDVRFKSFTIPAGVKKILISNPSPNGLIPTDPAGAVNRRMTTLHVTSPTWLPPPPPPQMVHASPGPMPVAALVFTPVTQPTG